MRHLIKNTSSKCSQFFLPILEKIKKNRSTIINKAVMTTFLITTISIGSAYADGEQDKGLSTIYHVYHKGERMGSVSDTSIIEDVVNQKVEEVATKFNDLSFTTAHEITYIPEQVFQATYNNEQVLDLINQQIGIFAEAVAIQVDGKSVAYVNSKEEAQDVIRNFKLKYVPETTLQKFERDQVETEPTPTQMPELGQSTILDVRLTEKVTYKQEEVPPESILSVEKATELLQKGTLEPKKHTVSEGEVLGRIANNYGLSIDEIIKLNPGLTEETLINIGDELIVMGYEPLLYVIVEEKQYKTEEIPFKTEVVKDENLFKGDSKVKQEGKKGEKRVLYSLTKKNGNVINKIIEREEIISEVQNKIIIKGSKVIPSRGTGDLVWPASGGYISSSMGYRWGRLHKGIDIAGPDNRTIKSVDNGTVTFAGWDGAYGNKVVINHNNGMKTIYGHLASISVKKGQTVQRGKKIGVMGTTGRSTGIHLHLEIYKNGKLVNPKDFY